MKYKLIIILVFFTGCLWASCNSNPESGDFIEFLALYPSKTLPLKIEYPDQNDTSFLPIVNDSLQIQFLGFPPLRKYGKVTFTNEVIGVFSEISDYGEDAVQLNTFTKEGKAISQFSFSGQYSNEYFISEINEEGKITKKITVWTPDGGEISSDITERYFVRDDGQIVRIED